MPHIEEEIKRVAMDFDHALTARDVIKIKDAFVDDSEIELLGVILKGKEGVQSWIDWLFNHLVKIEFTPVIIMVEGNIFFEEFILKGKLQDGTIVTSKQAEVLVYENLKIKSLRLYFDRLDFAGAVANGFLSKRIVKMVMDRSLEGLV